MSGGNTLNLDGVLDCLICTNALWFVKAYLLLYILSPVLNAFVDNAKQTVFRNVLIGFYVFQIIFGFMFPTSITFIDGGNSTISFVGLYLLGRYINLYRPRFTTLPKKMDMLVISSVILLVTAVFIIPSLIGYNPLSLAVRLSLYVSPTTIILSVFFVILFSKIKIQSKMINWIGMSCFSVYLLHQNPNVIPHYKMMCKLIHNNHGGFEYWSIILFLLATIFIVSILFDKIRIYLWKGVLKLH